MEQKYKFEFTLPELNVLTTGLGKLPMESALAVFNSLQQQYQIQQRPPAAKEEQLELPLEPKAE